MADTRSFNDQHPDAATWSGDPTDVQYLHSHCHPYSPVQLKRVNGVAIAECAECGADLITLKLAAEEHSRSGDEAPGRDDNDFTATLDELGYLAGYHLYDIRSADFELEVPGSEYVCHNDYGKQRDRLEVIKQLLGDAAFTEATAWVEDEWRQKRADIRFFRQCEECGSCEIDTRLGEACPVCGHAANVEQTA